MALHESLSICNIILKKYEVAVGAKSQICLSSNTITHLLWNLLDLATDEIEGDLNHNKKLQVDIPGKQKSQARVVIRRMLREKVRLSLLNPDLNVDKSWNQARNQLNKELDEGVALSSNSMGILKLW